MATERSHAYLAPATFDVLVAQWREALEAAETALRSAGHYLRAEQLAEHRRRFARERGDVDQLLRRLGREITQREIAPA